MSRERRSRAETYPEYKAGRGDMPADFRGQLSLIQEVLEALRIPSLSVEGYEADDVIATLTTQAADEGVQVLICTGDRDVLQLVSDAVTVLYPRKGVSDLTRFTPSEVSAKYGLTPAQYPDFAALRGDPSDNLPGIPGVGEKTAAKWVREFGSFDALVAGVDTVKGKVGDALREHLAAVMRNRQLTELVRDVPLDLEIPDLARQAWDRERVHALFDNLQFRVLRERLFATLTAAEPEAEEGFEVSYEPPGGRRSRPVARGERTGRHPGRGLVPRQLGSRERSAHRAGAGRDIGPSRLYAAGPAHRERRASHRRLAGRSGRAQGGPRRQGPLLALRQHGWTLAGITSDTQLAAYLALPGQRSFDLADLALRYLHRELRANTVGTTSPSS